MGLFYELRKEQACFGLLTMEKTLSHYYRILGGKSRPKFRSCDLESKVAEGFSLLEACELCSRGCGANRTEGELGVCGVADKMSVSSCFDHHGEEPFFVPSFTIFFRSCTFSCQFCQNWEISQASDAEDSHVVTEADLARIIDLHGYCRNVNFVGGEPTPYLPFIMKTLSKVKGDLPVVWNSNFYMSEASMDLLADAVDVYLSDFKYGNDECALRLSRVPDYSKVVRRNHLLAFQDSDLVIRHLILPNHFGCCTKPVLHFIAEHFGGKVVVNLMDQYRPCYKADEHPDITRRITEEEFRQAVNFARELGLNFIT